MNNFGYYPYFQNGNGVAADSKAVGDEFESIRDTVSNLFSIVGNVLVIN